MNEPIDRKHLPMVVNASTVATKSTHHQAHSPDCASWASQQGWSDEERRERLALLVRGRLN